MTKSDKWKRSVFPGIRDSGGEETGGRWVRLQKGNIRDPMITEQFCIFTVVTDTQTYAGGKVT